MSNGTLPPRILVSASSVSLNVETVTLTSYCAYFFSNALIAAGSM